mgnify:CR=1 FL=1|jgi:hypothetical protein
MRGQQRAQRGSSPVGRKAAENHMDATDPTPTTVEYNQCQEAVRRLTEYLSKELRPEEEEAVQQHLSQCQGCFAKFHFEETLLRTIRERAAEVRAPLPLREKILGLLAHEDASSA